MKRGSYANGYSPRAWGWTDYQALSIPVLLVFPTCVGVDRPRSATELAYTRIPHVRGGGPTLLNTRHSGFKYSPRAWGWTVA